MVASQQARTSRLAGRKALSRDRCPSEKATRLKVAISCQTWSSFAISSQMLSVATTSPTTEAAAPSGWRGHNHQLLLRATLAQPVRLNPATAKAVRSNLLWVSPRSPKRNIPIPMPALTISEARVATRKVFFKSTFTPSIRHTWILSGSVLKSLLRRARRKKCSQLLLSLFCARGCRRGKLPES